MDKQIDSSGRLAASITKSASKQTYYTIRFLVDRNRITDAYRAYGYFRWVDDVIDKEQGSRSEKIAFASRQISLLESCYRGESPKIQYPEEWMLIDLVRNDREKNSGLQIYLRNMMDVMAFDAGRCGKVISKVELAEYSHKLARAVTEALYYFIGHDNPSPRNEARYLAVTGAHITHMLRDAVEDVEEGYFNIPLEYLQTHGISPEGVKSHAYREWVCGRVFVAREYFQLGKICTSQVKNLRCRLAGFAYTARFEWMLHVIEKDNYCLRSEYPERKSVGAALWMGWHVLKAIIASLSIKTEPQCPAAQLARTEK